MLSERGIQVLQLDDAKKPDYDGPVATIDFDERKGHNTGS